MGLVQAKGRLRLNHLRGAFPLRLQPEICIPEQMVNLSFANTQALDNIKIDLLAGGAYLAPRKIPHNQTASSIAKPSGDPSMIDVGKYLLVGIPTVDWDVTISANVRLLAFPKRPENQQRFEAHWDGTGTPAGCFYHATAPVSCQGFSMDVARTLFGGGDPSGSTYYDLRWVAGFRRYSVLVRDAQYAQVRVSEAGLDVDGNPLEGAGDWQIVNASLKYGASSQKVAGEIPPEDPLTLEVSLIAQTMQLSFGATVSPYRVPGNILGPTAPPALTVVGGGLGAATYAVAYTWVDASGNESAPSQSATQALGAPGGIEVVLPGAPAACVTVNVYLSGPGTGGLRLAGSGPNAIGPLSIILDAPLPALSDPEPPTFTKPLITQVEARALGFTIFYAPADPIKWASSGIDPNPLPRILGNPIDLGFSPDVSTPPYYLLHGVNTAVARQSGEDWGGAGDGHPDALSFPAGSSITCTMISAPTAQNHIYQVEMESVPSGNYRGEEYADLTPFLSMLQVRVNGITSTAQTPSRAVIPKGITERIQFDPMALTIRHSLSFEADNFYGQWAGQSGATAVSMWLGLDFPAAYPMIPGRADSDGFVKHFLGYCDDYDFLTEDGRASILFNCCDQSEQLGRRVIASPPVMDGWNMYYAAYFVGQYAGLAKSQMAFRNLIPSDPYSTAPGDSNPYFLPIGEGFHPWTPRDRTLPCSSLFEYIRKPTGFLSYFDRAGAWQFHKWVPFGPGTGLKTFTQGVSGADGANLSEYWNFRLKASTKGTVNRVTTVGVDAFSPDWRIVASKREDALSINAPPGMEPANYVGFPSDLVWLDARFADAAFAAEAATRILEMLRIPKLQAQFTCWLKPDLMPMDVVFINDLKSGLAGVPMYVMGITNHWSVSGDGRQPMQTTVDAMFLT